VDPELDHVGPLLGSSRRLVHLCDPHLEQHLRPRPLPPDPLAVLAALQAPRVLALVHGRGYGRDGVRSFFSFPLSFRLADPLPSANRFTEAESNMIDLVAEYQQYQEAGMYVVLSLFSSSEQH
jgi:hypothetical protein